MAECFYEPCAAKICVLKSSHDINLQGLMRCCCSASGSADAFVFLEAVRELLTPTEALLPSQTKQSCTRKSFACSLFFLPVVSQVYHSIAQAAICKSWHTLCLPHYLLVYSL